MKLIDTSKFIRHLQLWDKRTGEWIAFDPWPIQVKYIRLLNTVRKIISLKKRQVGWSQLTGADSLLQCLFQLNFTTLVLSITEKDALVFLKRVRDMYKRIPGIKDVPDDAPEELKLLVAAKAGNKVIKGEDAGPEMVFASGSEIVSLSALKGRGMTANRVILDEAAFYILKLARTVLGTVLQGIEPAIDRAGGQLIIISTAYGMGMFYKYYMKAKAKLSGFVAVFVSCWDDPDFTPEKREQIIRDHGEDHANQEYPRTDMEAFLMSGRPRFELPILRNHYRKIMREPIAVGDLADREGKITADLHPKGRMKFWHKKDPRGQYIIPADVSEGINEGDYSNAKVLALPWLVEVAEWHGRIDPSDFGGVLVMLGRHYNNAILAPERNNHGIATISSIRKIHGYPDSLIHVSKLKHKESAQDAFIRPEERFGWVTTTSSKPLIIDMLANDIIHMKVPHLSVDDIEELETYVIGDNGDTNAEAGSYDDRVITLAIGRYIGERYYKEDIPAHHMCGNCLFWADKRGGTGLCERAGKYCHFSSWCRLFALEAGQRAWPMNERPKPSRSSGYVPLGKAGN